MTDFLIILVLLAIVTTAIIYMIKVKKNGGKCIGCSTVSGCTHRKSEVSGCGCGCDGIDGNKNGCDGNCHKK